MWDDLEEQVTLERRQLHRLLNTYHPLLERCAASEPDEIEISALASMLHSFYNGLENIFKRTALELRDPMPGGDSWHKDLLDRMAEATGNRSALLSSPLRDKIKEYMEFRHFFRHACTFHLRWNRMKALALGCEQTLLSLALPDGCTPREHSYQSGNHSYQINRARKVFGSLQVEIGAGKG